MLNKKLILLSIVIILAGVHLLYYASWTHDDPFITYRYAENLASGEGLVFNPGQKVEGYSNFLFLMMLVPAAKAGFPLLGISKIYGFFFMIATVILFFSFLYRYYSEMKYLNFLALFLLTLSGNAALWAMSGMETAASVFFVTVAWILLSRELRNNNPAPFPFSSFFLLAAALNRPEGAIYFFFLLPAVIGYSLKGKVDRKFIILWIICFLIPFGIYNIWRISYFGKLFPNTFYAKATGGLGVQAKAGLAYIFRYLARNPWLFLFVFFAPALKGGVLKKPARSTALLLITSQAFFIVVCGGDWMPLARFVCPVLAPLFFLFQEGLIETIKKLNFRDRDFKIRDALGILLALLILASLVQERRATRPIVYSVATDTLYKPHIALGEWLGENVPRDSLLAGEEAGIIPYYSGLRFLDLLGIVDQRIAHTEGPMHEKFDVEYVLEKKPDYVLLYTLNPLESGETLKARISVGQKLLSTERFIDQYNPVFSFPHGNDLAGRDYLTLFVRENAPVPEMAK